MFCNPSYCRSVKYKKDNNDPIVFKLKLIMKLEVKQSTELKQHYVVSAC